MLQDGAGSTRQLVDEEGAVQLSVSYTPWGDTMEIYGSGMLNLGYLGGVYDAGTGLIYMGNGQYYDPTTGSILTKNINSNQSNIPLNSNPSYFVISPILLLSLFFRNKKEKNNKWFAMVLLILLVSLFICMNFMLLGSVSDNVFATYNTPTLKPTWSYSDYFYPNPEINPNLPPEIKDQVIADIIYMNEVEQICTKLAEYHFPYPDVFPDKTPIEIFKDSCWQKIMFEYFRTDNKESPIYDSWSNEDWNLKQIHSARIINLMMHYQGEKWWEGDVPTTREWSAFLLMEEGSILSTEEGLDLMAKILLYKITHWGVAEFTPSSNPALNTAYVGNDSLNFTENDWNALFHPLQHSSIYLDMEKALNIIDNVLGNYDPITEVPDYLYWVSSNEKKRADNNAGMEITFETNTAAYYRTYDIDGDGQSYLLFLSNKSDFDKIIDFAN